MGGAGACRHLSRAPRGRAPSMPSESDVIRRVITAMGTLMIEWPLCHPVPRQSPIYTRSILNSSWWREERTVLNRQLLAATKEEQHCTLCCVSTSTVHPHHQDTASGCWSCCSSANTSVCNSHTVTRAFNVLKGSLRVPVNVSDLYCAVLLSYYCYRSVTGSWPRSPFISCI